MSSRILGVLGVLLLSLAGFGLFVWVSSELAFRGPYEVAREEIPVPWPLSPQEVQAEQQARVAARAAREAGLGSDPATVDPSAPLPEISAAELTGLARNHSLERGRDLVELRGGCIVCHGKDLAGGAIMDVPMVMGLIAPNLTPAGVTEGWTGADWSRALRHCVGADGHALLMPCIDHAMLSDREVSDIAAYVATVPPVQKVMPVAYMGPVRRLLIALGLGPLDYAVIDHAAARPAEPPSLDDALAYGKHLSHTCKGCHGPGLSGGPIPAGDPSWPVPPNLTPHETGLQGWTLQQFDEALRRGRRRDGSEIRFMPWKDFGRALSDKEVENLFAYLQTVEPRVLGSR